MIVYSYDNHVLQYTSTYVPNFSLTSIYYVSLIQLVSECYVLFYRQGLDLTTFGKWAVVTGELRSPLFCSCSFPPSWC